MAAPHVTGAAALYKASRPARDAGPGQARAPGVRQPRLEDRRRDPDRHHEPLLDVVAHRHCSATSRSPPPSPSDGPRSGRAARVKVRVEAIRAEDVAGPTIEPLGRRRLAARRRRCPTPLLSGFERLDVDAHDHRARRAPPSGTYFVDVTGAIGGTSHTTRVAIVVDTVAPTIGQPWLGDQLRARPTAAAGSAPSAGWPAAHGRDDDHRRLPGPLARRRRRWGAVDRRARVDGAIAGHSVRGRAHAYRAPGPGPRRGRQLERLEPGRAVRRRVVQDTSTTLATSGHLARVALALVVAAARPATRKAHRRVDRPHVHRPRRSRSSRPRGRKRGAARVYIDGVARPRRSTSTAEAPAPAADRVHADLDDDRDPHDPGRRGRDAAPPPGRRRRVRHPPVASRARSQSGRLRPGGRVTVRSSGGLGSRAHDPATRGRSTTVARSMWKGAIQFGLVTIPVKLYTATESEYTIRFNMLHETDLSRIQMKVWCPEDEKVISRGETVKGYEYAPDQYVVITDEDLEKVPLKTVRSIEIEQFAPRDAATEEHAKFTKQSYYIEPDKIGRKAFYLLRQVLEERGLTAICKVVIRDREALAVARPVRGHDAAHDPPLARRDPVDQGPGPAGRGVRVQAGRAQDGRAAGRGDDRVVRPAQLQGRVPRGAAQGHRGQGRGRRDRAARSRSRRAPTSST